MSDPQGDDENPVEDPVVIERLEENLDPSGAQDDGAYVAGPQPATPAGGNGGDASPGDITEHDDPGDVTASGSFGTRPMTPERDRRRFAWALLAITVVGSVLLGWLALDSSQEQWARLQGLIAPFQTLLGIAVGYYFADRRNSSG